MKSAIKINISQKQIILLQRQKAEIHDIKAALAVVNSKYWKYIQQFLSK